MIKDLILKNNEARIIVSKTFFGVGFGIDFCNAITFRKINWELRIDLFFIRFWWVNYGTHL